MGGFARRTSYWKAFARKYPGKAFLRLDGGAVFSSGAADSAVVNRWMLLGTYLSKLDAINLDPWDLSAWQELGDLAVSGKAVRKLLDLPLVTANVVPKVPNFPAVKRSIIKEIELGPPAGGKYRIGISGLLHDPEGRIPRADFEVQDPTAAAREVVAELLPKTDFRIFMTNMDLGSALSLAIAVPGINLLVVTHNYEEMSEPQQVGETLIAIPVNEGRMLSEIRLAIPPGSDKVQAEARFVPLDRTVPDDPAMVDLIRRAQDAVAAAERGDPAVR
jgi:2',3'-cyclic-nucleotide 2'-phosphodiesterase (5'-nucleotidase family)